jgi:hypothetical protein
MVHNHNKIQYNHNNLRKVVAKRKYRKEDTPIKVRTIILQRIRKTYSNKLVKLRTIKRRNSYFNSNLAMPN